MGKQHAGQPVRQLRLRGARSKKWRVAALIAMSVVILAAGFYFAGRSGVDPGVYSNDFNVFYHAAREVIAGRDPYQDSLGDWTPYLYPPLLAVAVAPLALLPLSIAAYLWFLLNAVAAIAACWMSAKLAHAVRSDADAERTNNINLNPERFLVGLTAIGALIVVARFALDNFSLGQVNPLIAGLVAAHVFFHARNKKLLSMIAFAIAASIKLTPAVFIVYHLAKRRFRFAAACTAMLAAVTVLSFLPLGRHAPNAARVFVDRTIRNQQGFDLAYAGNQSLRGLIERMRTSHSGDSAPNEPSRRPEDLVTLLMSLGLILISLVAARRASEEVFAAAPLISCLVLLSPLSWKAHFVVLILPVACLLAERARATTRVRMFWLSAALVFGFATFNLTSPRIIGLTAAEWSDEHSLIVVGGLAVFAASVAVAWTRKFEKQSAVC